MLSQATKWWVKWLGENRELILGASRIMIQSQGRINWWPRKRQSRLTNTKWFRPWYRKLSKIDQDISRKAKASRDLGAITSATMRIKTVIFRKRYVSFPKLKKSGSYLTWMMMACSTRMMFRTTSSTWLVPP